MASPSTTKTRDFRGELRELRKEVRQLRSSLIGVIGQDEEGEYNPAFVRKILRASREKPRYVFRNPQSFLKHIRGA